MAYNPILNSETDPRKPGTSSLFKRLVQNPIAMIRGESGAPRLTGAAVARIGDGLDVITVAAANTAQSSDAAWNPFTRGATNPNPSAGWTTVATYVNAVYSGSMRFKILHARTGTRDGGSVIRWLVNGAVVATSPQARTTSFVEAAANVSIEPGDTILVQQGQGLTVDGLVNQNPTVWGSDAYQEILPLLQASLR